MPEQFIISDRCSPEQRKAFEAINRGLETLGVSADEFDRYFRLQLVTACVSIAQSAPIELAEQLGDAAKIQIYGSKQRYAEISKKLKSLTSNVAVKIALKHPLSHPEDINKVMAAIQDKLVPELTSQSAKVINTFFGQFQDLESQLLTSEQMQLLDYFKNNVSDDVKPTRPRGPYENLLQECAEGRPLIIGKHIVWKTKGIDFTMPGIGDYVGLALAKAIDSIAYDKGFTTPERRKELKGVIQDIGLSMHELMEKSSATLETPAILSQQPKIGMASPIANGQSPIPYYILDESKQAAPTPKDRSAARAAEEERRAAEQAQRIAAEEAARIKREAEEAAKPLPYGIPVTEGTVFARIVKECGRAEQQHWKGIKNDEAREEQRQLNERMRYLRREEIEPISSLINAKLPEQKELADVLFTDSALRRAEFACKLPPAQNGKIPMHPDDFKYRAEEALVNFFTQNTTSMPEQDRNRHEQIGQRILQSPTMVIAALGDDNQLQELREIHKRLLANDKLGDAERTGLHNARLRIAYGLLDAIGIDTPALPSVQPVQSAQSPAVAEEKHEQPAVFHNVIADDAGPEKSSPVITTITAQPRELAPAIKERQQTDEEIIGGLQREEALVAARKHLLNDVQSHILTMQDNGYCYFECKLDVNDRKMPIQLIFSKEREDGTLERKTEVLRDHFAIFRDMGLTLGLDDARSLKVDVQSKVLNVASTDPANPEKTLYFEPPPAVRRRGVMELGLNEPLPPDAYDLGKHQNVKVDPGNGGMYTFKFKVPKIHKRKMGGPVELLTITIPLGIAMRTGTDAEVASTKAEVELRKNKVEEILDDVERASKTQGQRIWLYKGEVIRRLQTWLEKRGQTWERADSLLLEVEGAEEKFDQPRLLYQGKGDNTNKISLAPVRLKREPGGDNPSYVMHLSFTVGEKGKEALGRQVRARGVRLHTLDYDLAAKRAYQSLVGIRTEAGELITEGFLQQLQNYMNAHPEAEWSAQEDGKLHERVKIGNKHLQDFFADMLRYEHDVGVDATQALRQDGKTDVTLMAMRCCTGDHLRSVKPEREPIFLKNSQIQAKITLPTQDQTILRNFVEKVEKKIGDDLAEHYASVALNDPSHRGELDFEAEDQRKSAHRYHTNRIRGTLLRAVEASYSECFGRQLSRGWEERNWVDTVSSERRNGINGVAG